ncbi:MAG: chromosomal replication initiator protein DnaA [Proteobacteria bacterium]|nr:chromosomal replication initiator protein DnaA [Pseudomonadota bacterium]
MPLLIDEKITNKNDESDSLWQRISALLKQEFGDEIYDRWFAKLQLFSASKQEIVIGAPSKFLRDWIKREYLNSGSQSGKGVKQILLEDNPSLQDISIIYSKAEEESENSSNIESELNQNVVSISKHDNIFALGVDLNPKFTFENFVVGNCNKLAYKAAQIVAGAEENADFSAAEISPLFLYGGVGLGKTHLAQSVAWHIKNNDKSSKVIYLTAERFMYQFVQSLRNKDIMDFKERFRAIDVLIIDDLQFVAGKEGTQKELLHSLSSLIADNKRVILVCDKSPGDMSAMDEKLKSRISGGMVIDFKCPDYETRLEILKAKSKSLNIEIDEQILDLMATKINSSVRDLEGALKKMVANHMFTGEEISLHNAKNLLKDLFRTNYNSVTIELIQKLVAEYFSIKIADLKSNVRSRDVARPRQIAMYLAKKLTSKSLPDIGKEFGGKNHATIIHAVKKVEELILADSKLACDVRNIEEAISK